jgi:hypothetical protein
MPEDSGTPERLDLSTHPEVTGAAWTVAKSQAALGEAAYRLLAVVDLLEGVHRYLTPPADLADRQEHRRPYDVATDVLGTIECVTDILGSAIESLRRSAQTTDDELRLEFERDERKRRQFEQGGSGWLRW